MSALFSEYGPRPIADRPVSDWKLRAAAADDLNTLSFLVADRVGGSTADHRERLEDELQRITDGASRALWVAERPTGVVGFARVAFWESSTPDSGDPAPAGWYLGGVIVHPAHRRIGIAADLTRERLTWLASECYFVVNAQNRASIDLHEPFGFREIARGPKLTGIRFSGGTGVLFRAGRPSQQAAAR